MTPPQSTILRDHPRKFTFGGLVICGLALIGGEAVGMMIGIGVALCGAACWLDDARYQTVKRQAWTRFYGDLDRQAGQKAKP